jgi:DivIVA domain-containing protein
VHLAVAVGSECTWVRWHDAAVDPDADPIAPGPTEQDVTAIDARRKELHVAWFLGYRTGDVDTYLDEVVKAMRSRIRENEGLRAGSPVPLSQPGRERVTPFDVQGREFETARFLGGYRMRDIDEYLDNVTDMLTRLEAENEALRGSSDRRR